MGERDAVDLLMEERAYIDKGWCQGQFAEDENGEEVGEFYKAIRWCARGAVIQARRNFYNADTDPVVLEACSLLARAIGADPEDGFYAVESWNDAEGRTQIEVLEVFDRAINSATGTETTED